MSPLDPSPPTSGTYFFDDLGRFGDRPALVDADGHRMSYSELASAADAFGARLRDVSGQTRGVLALEMSSTIEAFVAYVGALRADWPVILMAEGTLRGTGGGFTSSVIDTFTPDLLYSVGPTQKWTLEKSPGDSAGDTPAVHPELAVMLSTSGSTGSAKLVRLSKTNIDANAGSIREYLSIESDRVAITNLPGHYSYGLSVVNSFLKSGAKIVLTSASVVDTGFWDLVASEGVTDLGGVPYTYELLERIDFRNKAPGSLKVLTQAGGRLSQERVLQYAEFAASHGLKMFVMYGQTEATARMSYLPPELTKTAADTIGRPIPGGEFAIQSDEGTEITAPDTPGELIYRGPNVMMGYALNRADLANGVEISALATGDIALRRTDGLFKIVGRSSRFTKIAGLRIGYDDIEAMLPDFGAAGYATGVDGELFVVLTEGDPDRIAKKISARCKIPATTVTAWSVDKVPVLSSGKIDYPTIRNEGAARSAAAAEARSTSDAGSVAGLIAQVMNTAPPEPDQSFGELGADSLGYLSVSIGLEEMLGELPDDWESLPIAELQARASLVDPAAVGAGRSKSTLSVGTDAVLRLLAITLIFTGHGSPDMTTFLRGGANVLFMLAGFSMASFQFSQLEKGHVWPILKGTFSRIVFPYYLVMTALVVLFSIPLTPSWYLLITVFTEQEARMPLFMFWFIESLIHAILLSCVLFLIPAFRDRMRRTPFVTSLAMAVAAFAFGLLGREVWRNGGDVNLTFDGWLYLFFLGWAVAFAKSNTQKALLVVLALAATGWQFIETQPSRVFWLSLATAVLLWVPKMTLHRTAVHWIAYISSTTFFMYLMHLMVVQVIRFESPINFPPVLDILLVFGGTVIAGIIYSEIWRFGLTRLARGWTAAKQKTAG